MKLVNQNLRITIMTLMLVSSIELSFAQQSAKALEVLSNNSSEVFYIKPDPSWVNLDPEEYPKILAEFYGIPADWELRTYSEESDKFGKVVKKYQHYDGYDVLGGDLIFTYDTENALKHVMGTLRKFDKNYTVNIDSTTAVNTVWDVLDRSDLALDRDPETWETYMPEVKLIYAPKNGDIGSTYVLCWEVHLILSDPDVFLYYVNAETGEIEYGYSAMPHSVGTGISIYSGVKNFNTMNGGISGYYTKDSVRNISAFDFGYQKVVPDLFGQGCDDPEAPLRYFTDENNLWTHDSVKAMVDVMWGMSKVYDYYLNVHERNSYDDKGAEIKNRIHYDGGTNTDKWCPIDSITYDRKWNNASWNGRTMQYGQGDGVVSSDWVTLDVVGHEFTHAVVKKTAGLIYQGESGALNESFADIFGTCVEFYGKAGNYQMGEESYTPGTAGDNMRDMSDPKTGGNPARNNTPNDGRCPDTYEGDFWKNTAAGAWDNGGVHFNSGVQNYWFYLLSEGSGGPATNDKNDNYEVTGIGRDTAQLIAYRGLTKYLTTRSDYEHARKAMLLAAEDLYGEDSKEYKATCEAWFAVNVGEKCCDSIELAFKVDSVTCKGRSDGKIDLTVTNHRKGSEDIDLTYRWFKSDTTTAVLATSQDINGLKAENYIVIVKDTVAKCEMVGDTLVHQPDTLQIKISGAGKYTGACERKFTITLTCNAQGGTKPYYYSWENQRKEIEAGGRTGFSRYVAAAVADKHGCLVSDGATVTYVPIRCSYDPNDIIGPPAFGDQGWVSIKATLPYKIRYENDPKFATGPAQKVEVKHVLDSNVNVNSFRLADFGFYKYNFTVPDNSIRYSKRLDLRDSFGIFLDVTAGINSSTREAFWTFESIDPSTGLAPLDGTKGFLAVNDTITHKGEGYVNYTVKPRSSANTGDSIRAIANIRFDDNPDINTPRIFNLIDALPPTSKVDSTSSIVDTTTFTLSLTGQDDMGGSGVGGYDIYVSTNGGPFVINSTNITDSTFSFNGDYGNKYGFFSRAFDNTSNYEALKTKADVEVTIAPDQFFKPIDTTTSLCSGDTLKITWFTTSLTTYNLEYTADSGATFTSIAKNISVADTLYNWIIPTNISGKRTYWLRAIGDNSTPIDSSKSFQLIQGPAINIGADTSFCDGESFTLTLDAGNGFISYLWSDNSTARTLNASTYGNYSVQVGNSEGCSAKDELMITKDMNPNVASTEITSPTCVGNNDGSISMVVVSGTAPYSYIWSNGMTVEDISGLSSGVYQVTITDTKECTYVRSETLSPPVPISSTMLLTDVKCFSGNDGTVDLSVSGGKSPYSYSWSNGSTNQDLSGLAAGSYFVSIKDDNNCIQLDTAVIAEPQLLSIAISSNNLKCNGSGDGSIDITVSGGTTGYSYSWSNGSTSEDLNALSANSYFVTVSDFNNCIASASTTLTEPASLSAPIASKNVSCNAGNDGSLNLTPSGGTSPYTYSWSNGATSEDINALIAGTYRVTLTDANNCSLTDSGTVTEPAALTLSATPVDVKCFGGNNGSVSLSVSGGTSPYKYIWNNSSTSKDLSGLIKGTYAVTMTDNNNCSIQTSSVVKEPTLLVLSHTSLNVQCNSGNDGSIDLSVSGATPGYSYNWSNGSTSQDISTLVKGAYSVTVTDANLCSETRTITINEPTALSLSKSLKHVQCKNGNDGSIDITPSGGTTPYKYLWSNGATSQDLSSLTAGTYTVTLTDNHSCVLTDVSVITEPTALTASITPTDVKCKNGNDGSIDVTTGGGSLPYQYKWSNGASTEDISNLFDGTYAVTITDDHGCILVRSADVNEPTALTSTIAGTDVLCKGGLDGKADLTAGGGISPYRYLWSNGSTTEDLVGVAAGTYAVTITDNNSCTKTDQIVITEPSALAKSSTLSHVLCNAGTNGAIDLSISGGTNPYTYRWSNGATSEDLTNLGAGTYVVTVTDDHNCVLLDTSIITQPTVLALSKVVKDVLCYAGSDGAIDITISGGVGPYSYKWSNGSVSEDLNNLILGTYVVTVTDANKCFMIESNIVAQPLLPLSSTLLIDSVKCFGENTGAISISVSGGTSGYDYFWSNGGTSQSISSLYKGKFTVVVRDKNNCVLYDTADVKEPNVLTASFKPSDVLCYGGNSGSIDMTVSGGTMSYSYNWSNSSALEDISNLTLGTYSVTITDINSCIYIDSAEVKEPLAPLSSGVLITDVKCFDGSDGAVDLNVNGGTVPYKFTWSNSETSQSIAGVKSGEYHVLIVDFNNCELRDTGLVNQPIAAIGLTEIISDVKCFGGADGAVDITPMGGTPPYNFSWSDGTSGEDISGKATGTYYLTLSDFNNCLFLDTFFINQPLAPLSTIIDVSDVQCFGGNDGSLDLSVSGGTNPYVFSWSNGSIGEDIGSLVTGSYNVLVTDKNNCIIRDTAFVNQPIAPLDVVFNTTDVKCFGGNNGALDIQVSGGTGPYTFVWSNTSTNEDIVNLLSAWYTVVITDAQNCELTDSAFVFEPTVLKTVSASTTATSDGSNGKAWTLPEGGTPPYSYLWDDVNGQLTDTAKNLIIGAYKVIVTDNNGCIVRDSIFVPIAPETSTIVMYPNPTTGVVTIANLDALGLDEPITVELIQLQGKTEQTFEIIGLSQFSFALDQNLFNGPYIVRISNFRGTVQRKLVLIR